jgi:hypothetical protein
MRAKIPACSPLPKQNTTDSADGSLTVAEIPDSQSFKSCSAAESERDPDSDSDTASAAASSGSE